MTAPPGALLLLIAYGAGLATGLARFPDPRVAFFTALIVAACVRRHALRIACVALAVGTLSGVFASRSDPRSCVRVHAAGPLRVTGRLAEPGASGVVALDVRNSRCRGRIAVLWPRGAHAGSGERVAIEGRWISRTGAFGAPDGILAARTVTSLGAGQRRLADHIHDAVADRSQRLFGARAGLVDALITGRRGDVPAPLKDAFTASGLVHLLSISGFHIGLIAGWILLALRLMRVPRHHAEGGAALLALGYVAFLGWPAPAARAGWLLVVVAWNRWRQRQVHPLALLGASCLIVIVFAPRDIASVGAWLSAAALGGAIAMSRWSDRALGASWGWRTLAGSIGATLGTAPITAGAFGQVALVGVVLNFIAIPLAAAAVPAVLAALLLDGIAPSMARAFAAAGGHLLAAIERVAAVGAAVPFGQWTTVAAPSAAVPWLVVIALVLAAMHGRATRGEAGRRMAWMAVAACWLALVVQLPRSGATGRLTLHFLDVGQGDATLIRTPHGRWVAVDAGPAGSGRDAGRRVVLPYFRRHGGRRIDLFVLSHAHRDHVGGAPVLVEQVPISVVLDPGQPFDEASYLSWLGQLSARGTRWRIAAAGDAWQIDGVGFRVLHPPPTWEGRGEDLNEDSVVLEVRYGAFVALLAGDAGFAAERELSRRVVPTDVLKVGHHGSRGSTGEALLTALRPAAAVVSLGTNRYGHPAPQTMARLAAAGVRTWRTDREGTVAVTTDGTTFTVRGRRTSATFHAARDTRPRR